MKSKLFLIMALLGILPLWLMAQQPGWNWATQTSGAPNAYNFGNNILKTGTDYQGNLIASGYSNSRIFLDDTMLFPSGTEYPNTYYSYLWKQDETSHTVFIKKFDGIVLSPISVSCDIYNNIYLWADIGVPTVFEDVQYNSSEGGLFVKFDPYGNVIWVKQHIRGDVSVTANGICFISGYFTGTKTIGDQTLTSFGREDMFIAKLDQNGDWQWAKQFGTAGDERCYQVAPLPNGECFLAGKAPSSCDFDGHTMFFTEGGLFVAKLNYNGNCTWLEGLGSSDYQIDEYFASICSNNPYIIYLYYHIRNDNNLQTSGIYVKRFNINELWTPDTIFHIPATSDVRSRKMVMDNAGNIYVCGYYYDPFIIGGYSYPWENGNFIFKLNGEGNIMWSYDHGQNVSDNEYNISYYDICVSYQGITYITLQTWGVRLVQPFYTYPGRGCYALRLSASGQPEWLASNWINTIGMEAKDIWRPTSGDAFVCGNFEGDSFWGNTYLKNHGSSGKDIFVTRFSPANQPVWTVCAGGEGNQEVSAIYTDSYLCSYVTGRFSGTMQFGDITILSSGAEDIYVAKLDEQGNWLWAFSAGGQGNDAGLDVVADNVGNVYACGFFSGAADFSIDDLEAQGATDDFVVKLNSIGTCINAVQSNIAGADQATALAIDNLDRLWLSNNAAPESSFPEAQRITIYRLSLGLDTLDSLSSNTAEDLCLSGLALDNSNNCYVIGTYRDELNFGSHSLTQQPNLSAFVMGIDSNLQTLWANNATSWNPVVPKAIIADDNGNCYIAGSIKEGGWFGSISVDGWGENDIFVAKLNSSGAWTWAKTNGSTLDDCATGIALKPNGLCSVVGRFAGRICLGNNWLEPMSQYDSFLAELCYTSETPEELLISPVPGLLSAYPNPFANELKICCETTEPADLKVNIYNLKGQLVRTLHSDTKSAGFHNLTWDGMDSRQNRCAAGIYLLRTQGTMTQLSQKVVKLKE